MPQESLRKVLTIKKEDIKKAKSMREKAILDAIALKGGASQESRLDHTLWKSGVFEVGVSKPGKEAIRKEGSTNPNDMSPYIKVNGVLKPESATFRDIFRELEHMSRRSKWALELLGCMFVRSALLLDHEISGISVIYVPPAVVLKEIQKDIPDLFGVPLGVFLQYAEMIALNEEVKYFTKGSLRGKPYGSGAGRKNNLLTCAHLIAVLLGRAELVDFAYGFSMMRGVSPLTDKRAREFFPLLME